MKRFYTVLDVEMGWKLSLRGCLEGLEEHHVIEFTRVNDGRWSMHLLGSSISIMGGLFEDEDMDLLHHLCSDCATELTMHDIQRGPGEGQCYACGMAQIEWMNDFTSQADPAVFPF